jgi:hypothetical protein
LKTKNPFVQEQKMTQKDRPGAPGDDAKAPAGAGKSTRVKFDDSSMTSAYANVCNASSTREEVTLLFGTNQTWHTGGDELVIKLSNRIILSPYAAKRLATLLNNIMNQYEERYGALDSRGQDSTH